VCRFESIQQVGEHRLCVIAWEPSTHSGLVGQSEGGLTPAQLRLLHAKDSLGE